jgi:hypothetical protein
MNSETNRPTLAEHLGMTEIGSIVQKRFFGGYDVPLMQFLTVGLWLFLKGVVLGRARCNSLEVVAKMLVGLESLAETFAQFGIPRQEAANSEDWVYEYLRKVANDGMAYYKKCYQKEPESFLDLWLTSFAPPEVDFRDVQKMKELAKRKIRLGVALQQSYTWLLAGIGFGATFPKLTERMWKLEYEKHNPEAWAFARQCGLDIPEKFTPLPLEEMEQQVLVEVASYVTEYFPELVEPLSLHLR